MEKTHRGTAKYARTSIQDGVFSPLRFYKLLNSTINVVFSSLHCEWFLKVLNADKKNTTLDLCWSQLTCVHFSYLRFLVGGEDFPLYTTKIDNMAQRKMQKLLLQE